MAAHGEEMRPRPPTAPRPRGKEKKDADGSPRSKEPRERRGSNGDGGSNEVDKSKKQGARREHRRSKEKVADNWRHHFHQFLAVSNPGLFTQMSRGSLYLQFTPLSGEDVELIASVLAGNVPLKCFGLANCQISDEQCRKILTAATNNPNLKRLDLSWNPITEAVAPAILEFMKNRPLEELNLIGTGTTHETQMRVWNLLPKRSPSNGVGESPPSPKPHLNTLQLNELVAKYYDTPSNLEQALKHMKLLEDEVKYIIITIAERLWAVNRLEKVLEVLLIGHRTNSHDLGILFRLCKIYWDLGNAQSKAARDMYYSVGLAFAERAVLLDDKHVHQGFLKWQRDFSAGLAASTPSLSDSSNAPATLPGGKHVPGNRRVIASSSEHISPRAISQRPLAASAVIFSKKEKDNKLVMTPYSSGSFSELPNIERRRSHTMDGGPGITFKEALKISTDTGPHSPKKAQSITELKAENEELRAQMSILYDELSRLKKKEDKNLRDSPKESAPISPHGHASKREEELDQRIAVQFAQLSALNVQMQTMVGKLESTRKQVIAMKDEERALLQTIGRLSKKEQKIEAKKAKQQGIIGKAFVKLDLKHIVINEALSRGRGGSGATVHACTVDGWSCACKELDIADIITGDTEEGFMQEVQLLEKLPYHPNIVKYLFHEKKGHRVRLFMTRYHSNLTDYMVTRKDSPFTPAAIVRYALLVLSGLEFLHKNQVLHRDLKSDNIFVMLDEKKEICQLAIGDFDVAKRLKLEQSNAKAVVGTPYIMAPEVLLRQQYSYPSDVFSYGMVLFELMAMKRPYEGRLFDVPELIIGAVPPDLPATVLSDASYTNLVRVHRACLRKEAERPTIDEVRSMLSSG